MSSIVSIKNITFRRGDRVIFDDVSLEIPEGKVTVVMGPSGTGKTTLLKLITAQVTPESGSIEVEGTDIHKCSRKQRFTLRQKMGFLFQSGALLTDMSVFENVAFPLRHHTKLSEAMIRDIVLMKLEAVGLRGAQNLNPAELSGGMARRVALARAIAFDPMMVLYDEPFTGQDPISMGVLVRLIRNMNEVLGLTSVVVSHDVEEALSIADYVAIISEGKIVAQGSKNDVLTSDSPWVQQFIQAEADGPVPFHYEASTLEEDFMRGKW